jgi:hypothetical protein
MSVDIRDGRAMRGQTWTIVISLGLAIVMVANTVNEDHQHGPCHKEQGHCGEWVNLNTDLEPAITRWHPGDRCSKWVQTQVFRSRGVGKDHHTCRPG